MGIMDDLVTAGKFLHSHSLVIGTGGNISSRTGNDVHIKKCGADMSLGASSDYITLSLTDERQSPASAELSSETPLHIASYLCRKDIFAVAHTHSPYAIAAAEKFSSLESPSYEYDCMVGKSSPVLPYIQPGSSELAKTVAMAFASGANAVILKHHGVVTVGSDIKEACLRALAVERAAMIILLSR